ncbi:MAG TPA: DUF1570 domain-containing protein, partial [Myxococcales bacterium]|nr:DUF1570 domain-containing protein [Myxococcales bacterium]
MHRRLPALASSLLLCTCAHLGGSPRDLAAGWLELRSEHFRLRTNLDPEEGAELISVLEDDLQALAQAVPSGRVPPGEVNVIAFSSVEQVREFDPHPAFYVSNGRGTLIVLGAEATFLPGRELPVGQEATHELAHYVTAPGARGWPRWLAEGMAQYLETVALEGRGEGRTAVIGRASPSLVYSMQAGTVPLRKLWEWDTATQLAAADEHHLYVTAWAWVHFLTNRHPGQLLDWERRLAAGEEPRPAFAAAFPGLTDELLDGELYGYLGGGEYVTSTRPIPERGLRASVSPLPPAS